MLRSLRELKGYAIQTQDGYKGKVNDFYFDDWVWIIRYLVADTGTWLMGRQVLISPVSFEIPDWKTRIFPLELTKAQIEGSPSIDFEKPVSRQMETNLHGYYRWEPYWIDTGLAADLTSVVSVAEEEGDPHLQSMKSVLGYRIQAKDGEIGHIADFIVDDEVWAIRYVVLDTKNWLPGKKVLIASEWVKEIKFNDSAATIPFLTRDQIKNSPPFNPAEAVNRQYETQYYDYFGRPKYWTKP